VHGALLEASSDAPEGLQASHEPFHSVALCVNSGVEAVPPVAHVYQMWVAPESRGLGAGLMLLRSVVEWAREAKAERVVLNVTCGDTPARRLYAHLGFRATGDPAPLRPGSTILAQPMVLDL
jgi:ribosomal protein S18 acetylase RimI-like enzyme